MWRFCLICFSTLLTLFFLNSSVPYSLKNWHNAVPYDSQELDLSKHFGWASETKGGFGGKIIRVTNLNATGEGSFAAALAVKERRIIVFEVGGNIDLKGNVLKVSQPHLSIVGQSAPSPGITIINGGLMIGTHDVIVQHIRIRPGSLCTNLDGLSTYKNASNIIVDHCTLTWAVDENLSMGGPRFEGVSPDEWRRNTSHRITFSNNIIGEGLFHSTHAKGGHSMGTLVHDNVTEVLLMRNLYANNNDRNAFFKGGSRGVFLNNYIYNPGVGALKYSLVGKEWKDKDWQEGYLTVIGNVFQKGENTQVDLPLLIASYGELRLFMEDNLVFDKKGNRVNDLYKGNRSKFVKSKPIWHSNLVVLSATELKNYLAKDVGARPWDRDNYDTKLIADVLNRNGRIIDSESDKGGFKKQKATYSKFDESEWDLKSLKKR